MTTTFDLTTKFQPNATTRTVAAFIETRSYDPTFWLAATEADLVRLEEWLQGNRVFKSFRRYMTIGLAVAGVAYLTLALLSGLTNLPGPGALSALLLILLFFDSNRIASPGRMWGKLLGFGDAGRIAKGLRRESPLDVDRAKAEIQGHPEAAAFLEEVSRHRAVVHADVLCARRMSEKTT